MSIFFDCVRTSLLRSKKHYFLSRIPKNVSFWFFWLEKKHLKKRSIFWQKPWTNPFAKKRFFSTFWELYFWGPKNFFFYPEYQKIFLYGFLQKRNISEKAQFFDNNHELTPLENVDFFRVFRSFLLCSKKHTPEYQKMFLYAFFLLKKKTYEKKVDFLTKTMD